MHAALYGLGAYGTALGTTALGLPEIVVWPAVLAVAAALAAGLGWAVLRLAELFLAVVTLAVGLAFFTLLSQLPVTGGQNGLFVDPVTVAGVPQSIVDYYLAAIVFGICLVLAVRLTRYRFGRQVHTVGNDPVIAASTGTNPTVGRIQLFTISSVMAAAAGLVYAHALQFVSPAEFGLNKSILILAMVVIGGLASIPGAVFGAVLLVLAPELFASLESWNTMLYGLLLVGVLLISPGGLMGLARRVGRRLRPSGSATVPTGVSS